VVKPSPKLFELVLNRVGVSCEEVVVVGESPRRDLGGAQSAGIECVLVGGATHPDALGSFDSLLQICGITQKIAAPGSADFFD
jgi:FMN phosphatase YigB (HAD superfamily)